ncbi:replicative DNA helicase [Kitasatospora sp. NPDC054939]
MHLVKPHPDQPDNHDADDIPDGGPSNLWAEEATVGGMMFDRDKVGDVCTVLKPRDYLRPAHEAIHLAIVRLFTRGEPTDPIAVAAELTKAGDLARCGGPGYLHKLLQTASTALDPVYCAGIVHEQAVLRRLVEAGTRIAAMGRAGEGEVQEIVDAAQSELFAVADEHADEDMVLLADSMEGHLDELEARRDTSGKLVGVPTGFTDLDKLTGGLRPGQMIVVAARPGMGKSTLALDVARAAAIRHGIHTVIFSLEMNRSEITDRLLSAEARVLLDHIRSGELTDDDWTRIARHLPAITEAPLYIDASSNLTGMDIRTKSRRLAARHKLGLIVVDYLQLMQSGGGKAENRQLEVSEISRGLKTLAKELNVPVIALSQLNRGPEQRTDKRPVVSDLRESGSIEQDADMVILLHREDAYEKESERAGEVDVIVGKHRNGPTCTITVANQLHYSHFVDMAAEH